MRQRPFRGSSIGVVIGLLALSSTLTSCRETTQCATAGSSDDLVATLVAHHGNHAEFVIESVQPSPNVPPGDAPALVVGGHVKVHYDGSTAQFLHVGARYDVALSWLHGEYWSDIHTADRPCSDGTGYADGSAIDTSLWARYLVRDVVYLLAVGSILTFAIRRVRRLQRRRQRARTVG